MGKKHFIKKENVRRFRLVHQSVVEGNPSGEGPVFAEITRGGGGAIVDFETMDQSACGDRKSSTKTFDTDLSECDDKSRNETFDTDMSECDGKSPNENAGEAAEYGILYDDCRYDYTKHLKQIGTLPGTVFIPKSNDAPDQATGHTDASDQGTDDTDQTIDAFDQTAVREVLQALDDDAFGDEDFEDDFVIKLDKARILCTEEQFNESLRHNRRPRQCKQDIGDESFPSDSMAQLDFIRHQLRDDDPHFKERVLLQASTDEEDCISVTSSDYDDFDCQSIIDTHSNTENRPSVIRDRPSISRDRPSSSRDRPSSSRDRPSSSREALDREAFNPIRLSRKTGLPMTPAPTPTPTESVPAVNKGAARPKNESAEEKRLRKAAAKGGRRASRKSQMRSLPSQSSLNF